MSVNKWAMAYVKGGEILNHSLCFFKTRKRARHSKKLLEPFFRNEKDFEVSIFKVEKSNNQMTLTKSW